MPPRNASKLLFFDVDTMAATGVAEALVPQNSDDNNEESVKNLKSTANMASVEVPGPLPPSSSDDNVADTSQKMVEDTAEREKRGDGGLLSRVQTQTRWGELRGKVSLHMGINVRLLLLQDLNHDSHVLHSFRRSYCDREV